MKAIGIKMVELQPMRASMALSTGYKIGNAHILLSRLTRAGVDFKELI